MRDPGARRGSLVILHRSSFIVSRPSLAGRLWPGRFRSEGPLGVALRTGRPRQGTLSLQLRGPQLPVFRACQRREKGDAVVDVAFRQRQRLDVLIKPGVLEPSALVVVIHDIPK